MLLTVDRNDASPRWRGDVDDRELARAAALLGVQRPVEIKRANGKHRKGAHRWREDRHLITLSTYSTVEMANRTLIHELTHAAQTERYGDHDAFVQEYDSERRRRDYTHNRFEVEARQTAERLRWDLSLTFPRGYDRGVEADRAQPSPEEMARRVALVREALGANAVVVTRRVVLAPPEDEPLRACTYVNHRGPRELPLSAFPTRKSGPRAGKPVGWCQNCGSLYKKDKREGRV